MDDDIAFTEIEVRRISQHSPLLGAPDDPTNAYQSNPVAAQLGHYLFFDTRFSRNTQISCATCHMPDRVFTDGKSVALGLTEGVRHTPSLMNAGYNRWFFWDGRVDTLWSQALHPFESKREFGGSRLGVLHALHASEELTHAYESVYGTLPSLDDHVRFPLSARPGTPEWEAMSPQDQYAVNRAFSNLGKALAAYEARLVSGESPFDTFAASLLVDDPVGQNAISSAAKRGLRLFIGKANCRLCHSGPLFTDLEFHNTGIPPLRGGTLPVDSGRYGGIQSLLVSDTFSASGQFSDAPEGQRSRRTRTLVLNQEHWGSFKTPSLRHVTETGPYMHQGQLTSIEDVLHYYNTLEEMVVVDHHQETVLEPLNLSKEELQDLASFLGTLHGAMSNKSLLFPPDSPVFSVGEEE